MRTMVSALCTIVVVVIFAVFANATTDYCSLKTCTKGPHTVCKYGFLNVDRYRCTSIRSSNLARSEIQEILGMHNTLRARVARGSELRGNPGPQPPAVNLRSLIWDTELAKIAQSWADRCYYDHDECRDTARFPVGQNIAYDSHTYGYLVKFNNLVMGWFEEVKLFNGHQVESVTDFTDVTHYTQMMWADTKYLGCGGVRYRDGQRYITYLVCNYGPKGNWYGEAMYKVR